MIKSKFTPSQIHLWTSSDWRDWLQGLFDEAYQREMHCGYDEHIGMAAIGSLNQAVRQVVEKGLPSEPHLAMTAMVHAMFLSYVNCELDGKDSSGRSSMGSVFNTLLCKLPDNFADLQGEWQFVCTHRRMPEGAIFS